MDADPASYVRGQYAGYRATAGVASRSTTETYAALELRIDNERWRGVPFYIRTGKHLPVTQTELRLIFRDASPLTFLTRPTQPSANELVLRIDPATGLRIILEAHRADASGPEPITLGMEFADQGGEGPTPYETLFEAALRGDRSPSHDRRRSKRPGASFNRSSTPSGAPTATGAAPGARQPPTSSLQKASTGAHRGHRDARPPSTAEQVGRLQPGEAGPEMSRVPRLEGAAVVEVASFRAALRSFLADSDRVARASGLTPQRHLLLLMIKGAADGSERAPSPSSSIASNSRRKP